MRLVPFVALLTVVLFSPRPASCALVHRTVTLRAFYDYQVGVVVCQDAIDFSTQSVVNCHHAEADFTYWEEVRCCAFEMGGVKMLPTDTPFDEVYLAPADGYFSGSRPLAFNATFLIKTADPLYAKLIVRPSEESCECIEVEYVVQTDGTRALAPGVPVESSTWGSIKALYR